MKITKSMDIDGLKRAACINAPNHDAWLRVRKWLVSAFDGKDTASIKICEWALLQKMAWKIIA